MLEPPIGIFDTFYSLRLRLLTKLASENLLVKMNFINKNKKDKKKKKHFLCQLIKKAIMAETLG